MKDQPIIGPPSVSNPPDRVTRNELSWLAAIFLLTALVYGQTLWFSFVNFDDDAHIYDNIHVRSGLNQDNVRWAFGIHGPSQWHPLAWISHQVDSQLFGARLRGPDAGGHHGVNLLLHLCNVALVYATFRKLLGRAEPALISAAIFGVHPLNVETVAWVSERRNVLSLFFSLTTMLAYIRYARHPGWGNYLAVCLMHLAALMAKPLAVTIPCVLSLLDFWPLRRWGAVQVADRPSRLWRRWLPVFDKLPLLALSVVSCVLTVMCQQAAGVVSSLSAIPLNVRLANSFAAYGDYLRQMIWPFQLAVFYPHPALIDANPWPALLVPAVAGAVVLLLLTLFAGMTCQRYPSLLTGWLWFLGTLVPMIGLMQVGLQQRADRYLYLPMLGLLLAVTGSMPWNRCQAILGRWWSRAVVAGLLLALSARAADQVATWHDSLTLFEHALAVNSRNHWAHLNAGLARQERGEWNLAAGHFAAALAIDPDYALAHYNLGVLQYERGDIHSAAQHFADAVRLNPLQADAWVRLGAIHGRMGRMNQAEQAFRTACVNDPEHVDAWFNLGLILEQRHEYLPARDAYQTVLRIDSGFRPARDRLARLPMSDAP